MIYCIWYPPGGFGHYVNSVISIYGENFKRPGTTDFKFSRSGNSHGNERTAPVYFHDSNNYEFDFEPDYHYSVLIDNGNNISRKFEKFFPGATVIKISYDDVSWPILAKTVVSKAQGIADFDNHFSELLKHWDSSEPWAIRENYFLYLRDNPLRKFWPKTEHLTLDLLEIVDYNKFITKISNGNIVLTNFENTHHQFLQHNQDYIKPVTESLQLMDAVSRGTEFDLSWFKNNIWAQAVVYYFIWLKYGIEVPHNDYSDWFTNVKDIATMLSIHGVSA